MSQRTLLMLETGDIQEFIFGSNNLRVNVGASALVTAVTNEWIRDLLPDLHDIGDGASSSPGGGRVDSVYRGGGNTLLLFHDDMAADAFVREFSTRLLEEAPGLLTVVERLTIRWDQDSLRDKLQELRGRLARRKAAFSLGRPLPGLGVTAACVFTGEPAAHIRRISPNDPPTLFSASVAARLGCFQQGDADLRSLLPENLPPDVRPVSDFDDFGTHGESSYIAIVHADGNNMGDRIKDLPFDNGGDRTAANDAYALLLANFSKKASEAASEALRATLVALWESRSEEEGEDGVEVYWQRRRAQDGRVLTPAQRERLPKVSLNKPRRENYDRPILPFRPVVFGGDDVTFVCDGRLGLALAHYYLTVYGEQTLADGKPAVGRAGVAIVHAHFPFAQGYDLAEALARSAKDKSDQGRKATLDWHFGVNGVISHLKEMRQDAYTVSGGALTARPLPLASNNWRQWSTFENLVGQFQTGQDWIGRRNKVKALMGVLRDGADHTAHFLENYRLGSLPSPPNYPDLARTGWMGNETPYFDALEMLDLYIPLEQEALV